MDPVLVVNAGSSSLRFSVFEREGGETFQRLHGQMDGIGVRPRLVIKSGQDIVVDSSFEIDQVPNPSSAMRVAGEWLRCKLRVDPVAVGHRVSHGGVEFDRPTRITAGVLERLGHLEFLAPLHQPYNLAVIRSLLVNFPDLPQVACFDTAFHRSHSALADWYAVPRALRDEGVRRYGFHGLSCESVAMRLRDFGDREAGGRTIIAHLGRGASMCAMMNGRSVESSMGFSALDGLPMGTRPGQLDPGVVLYLIGKKRMKPAQVEEFLYNECGLKGISGITSDVRDLLKSDEKSAKFAIDYFSYRVAMMAGALVSVLGGLDAFVFTAGIGENSPVVRQKIVERLGWLGFRLDTEKNHRNGPVVSSDDSLVKVLVIPTNEELVIARHTYDMLIPSENV